MLLSICYFRQGKVYLIILKHFGVSELNAHFDLERIAVAQNLGPHKSENIL